MTALLPGTRGRNRTPLASRETSAHPATSRGGRCALARRAAGRHSRAKVDRRAQVLSRVDSLMLKPPLIAVGAGIEHVGEAAGSLSDLAGGLVYAAGQAIAKTGLDEPTVNVAFSATSLAISLAEYADGE